jgi:hypothetical protein
MGGIRIPVVSALCSLALCLCACASQKSQSALPQDGPREILIMSPYMRVGGQLPVQDDHSGLTQDQIGMDFLVTGQMEARYGVYTLVENPRGRTGTTFALTFAVRELEQTARQFDGCEVSVTGTLAQVFSPWSKELRVTQIQLIE